MIIPVAELVTLLCHVENVDLAVGRVLTALKDSGKHKNTLVTFTSDNVPETLRHYKNAARSYGKPDPLRGMKLWTTEAGFRVVGIARWPDTIAAGQVIDTPVSSLDFLPTFCQLANAPVPTDLALDGTVISPGFGSSTIPRSKPLLWCYYNPINEHRVAMRHSNWKVHAKLNGGAIAQILHSNNAETARSAKLTDIEIYRVTEDISEAKNRDKENPEDLQRLTDVLQTAYANLIADSHV
ncbi:MAG: arylsulfatase A [Verrucomicrobiales bacterium]